MRFDFIYQKFYKGERVKYIRKKGGMVIQYGETGTVLANWHALAGGLIPINWDNEGHCRYSLLGCPNHHGWGVNAGDLEKIL